MNGDTLKTFGAGIQRLIDKKDLTEEETYSMFREVLMNKQPDLQQGAFLAALKSKGETAHEIAGAWQAINELDTVEVTADLPEKLVENSGTGMDSLKTFNVSSAAAIVAAACGAKMARHGARALTSFCGTVDILESVGLDVECDINVIEKSIKAQGIGLFNGMSPKVHPAALGRILSQIRFGSTLNIAASLANPANPTRGLRGVYAESIVALTAEVMSEIGYEKGMVVHGKDDKLDGGMDELSITGETIVQTFNGEKRARSKLRPEDVGLNTAQFEDIAATGNLAAESMRFLRVLAGKEHDACIDFTCLNAGAILQVADIAQSIEDGIQVSRQAIANGTALEKLRNWVEVQNSDPRAGVDRLALLMNKACVD